MMATFDCICKEKSMRYFYVAVLSSFAVSACAMLPTPNQTTQDLGEVTFTAKPNSKPSAPTLNQMPQAQVNIQKKDVPNTPVAPITTTQTATTIASTTTTLTPQAVNQPQSTGQENVNTVVNAFIVKTDPAGKETLIPVNVGTAVKSGDILEYQGLFTNNGDRIRTMEVTLSIADGTEFTGFLHPKTAKGSADGQRFVNMPIRVNVGGQVQNLAFGNYKALRWTVEDIGLGGTAVVKYRAKLK